MRAIADFKLSAKQLNNIVHSVTEQMKIGANGGQSCFKMLSSHLSVASGNECGDYIALDFGGTNIRADLIELDGMGAARIFQSASAQIPQSLMQSTSDAHELFAFVASIVAKVVPDDKLYLLGHTFSFPVRQSDAVDGVLVEWAKEFATSGMIGQQINQLLTVELNRLGIYNVHPTALLNDTVATLLAASYTQRHVTIGSICGTGHNSAFFDKQNNMVINLESGNFNILPRNMYDELLDRQSVNPGRQFLEKMSSGRYLGELFRLAIARVEFAQPFCLDTQIIAGLVQGVDERFSSSERELAATIVQRAASLVAASYMGVIAYVDEHLKDTHNIAIDGSLYEKMPLYAQSIRAVLDEQLGQKAHQVNLFLENRGSSLGSAVAAAIVGLADRR